LKERCIFEMICEKDLIRLKKEIEESTNPLFIFDNDPDGFCSAAILLKNSEKGNSLPMKSFPDFEDSLIEKISDLSPDKIFILDKPFVNLTFLRMMHERGIKVFIIDHHEIKLNLELESLANFFTSFPTSEPTSYICQKIYNRKNTLWISLIGCIYDVYLPEFVEEFKEYYPEMINTQIPISRLRYSSEIGKLTQILSLALKASNNTIQNMIQLFLDSQGPKDILFEDEKNNYIHRRYKFLNKIIERNLEKAKEYPKLVFLEYSGEYSLSSDISNFLFFKHPDKFIVVCYKKYDAINISIRGCGSKEISEIIVREIENSSGGGHVLACGIRIPSESFNNFKKIIFDRFNV
jgi:oligoribonuclease NrnB/cAMP/cGMP phosphodiesterase (DHH superfamily)